MSARTRTIVQLSLLIFRMQLLLIAVKHLLERILEGIKQYGVPIWRKVFPDKQTVPEEYECPYCGKTIERCMMESESNAIESRGPHSSA
jgi:hypothetical protein